MCIGKYNPDIIIGTETHLDSSVNSSELFPSNYSVIRKDRHFDNSKGGVLIAMKDYLIGTHRTELDTKCETVWVTIKIHYKDQRMSLLGHFIDHHNLVILMTT